MVKEHTASIDCCLAEILDMAEFLIKGLLSLGEGEEFLKMLSVNTSSWAGAYFCCYFVMILYQPCISAIPGTSV